MVTFKRNNFFVLLFQNHEILRASFVKCEAMLLGLPFAAEGGGGGRGGKEGNLSRTLISLTKLINIRGLE